MANYTVLEMTQDILSAMDSDEVNSIGDTIEAQQVVTIIKNCYNDIVSGVEFPDQYDIFQLDPSLDVTKPVTMYIPEAFENTAWVKYNKQKSTYLVEVDSNSWTSPDGITIHFGTEESNFSSVGPSGGSDYIQWKDIIFLTREKFFDEISMLRSDQTNVTTYTENGIELLCRNDKHPETWTILDNRTIIFDSYDSVEDATLQSNNTMCFGKRNLNFITLDTWVIPLDAKYTSYLFNEAKSTAFIELKQQVNVKAEKMSRVAKIKTQRIKYAAPYPDDPLLRAPDYGRKYAPTHYRKGTY